MSAHYVGDDDADLNRAYYAEIRAMNRRDPKRYDCPDCGRKGVLSASDKAKGYHCSACTREAEGPMYDGGMFGDY